MVKVCTIYLVRHGETDWNLTRLMQGRTSGVPLTKAGIKQTRKLIHKFQAIKFAAIFSSDLLRARQTASIFAYPRKLPVKIHPLLRERSFGKFEGKDAQTYKAELKQVLKKFDQLSDKEKFRFRFPHGIESLNSVTTRLITFLQQAAKTHLGKNILVITHGGVMRLFLIHLGFARYQQLPPYSIDNTAYVKLLSDGKDFSIKEVFGVNLHAS